MTYSYEHMMPSPTYQTTFDLIIAKDLRGLEKLANSTDSFIKEFDKVFDKHRRLFDGSDLLIYSLRLEKHLISSPPPELNILNIPSVVFEKEFNKGWGNITNYIDLDIPEDSLYRKLLACIPIIGIIPTVLNENSLRKKIKQAKSSKYLVKLINIKNHYKICSIIRELQTFALIVMGIALTILSWPLGIGSGIIVGSCVVYNAYKIRKNNQTIHKLQMKTS